ncbi:MAG: YraN family protein [Pseudomonadota bacterium]
MTDRRAAEKRGRRGESIAALFLRLKGYSVLARRVRTPAGEIDLIVRKGKLVVFVEVKARSDLNTALESVTQIARRRITRAAEIWMARRSELAGCDWRYDIVAIVPGQLPHHARDAWRPAET